MPNEAEGSTTAAIEAYRRGFTPIPIVAGDKRPYGAAWTLRTWTGEAEVEQAFKGWASEGVTNMGLLLGERGGNLVDIDLDHAESLRLGPILLPKTAMMSGRRGRPKSHYWYKIEGEVPGTRRYKMPDLVSPRPEDDLKRVSIELRSNGSQTVVPPSVHPSGEAYEWSGKPWGGDKGPAVVNGKTLARQVALLGMIAVLLERWPKSGSRHDAYLALAGGMLRQHPYWEKDDNLAKVISVIAAVTRDEDGAAARVAEVIPTTIGRLRAQEDNRYVVGFGRLAEIIGNEHADMVKRMAREVESLSDAKPEPIRREPTIVTRDGEEVEVDPDGVVSALPPEVRNPMEERASSWDRVDMEPYILGQVVMPEPNVLIREDGKGLMYPGRVNSLYGLSESGKSWIAMYACQQEMAKGDRVMYIDFEDSPEGTWSRMRLMGVGADDMLQFAYVHPEDPLADMLRGRFSPRPDDPHYERSRGFKTLLETYDPTLIVVDGMTTLYNSHGLDTNQAADTDVISSWLRTLARNGRSTVIVIDHTGKGGERGSSPIGAHHKIAMIQGTAIQVVPIVQPMPGAKGEIELLVYKDRPGAVRMVSGPVRRQNRTQLAAVAYIDSTEPGVTRITLEVPSMDEDDLDGDFDKAAERAEREREKREWAQIVRKMRDLVMLTAFEGEIGTLSLSKVEIVARCWPDDLDDVDAVRVENSPALDEAVKQMVDDGTLEQSGRGRGTRYTLT